MGRENFTIACLIKKGHPQFYTGGEWDNNVHRASLYSPNQVEEKAKELRARFSDVSIVYIIQDRNFDYYDGTKFVYNLIDAKFYSNGEAEKVLEKLVQSGA